MSIVKVARVVVPGLLVGAAALMFAGPRATSAAPAATSYRIDPVHSSVYFRVLHMGTSYQYGRFNDVDGDLELGGDQGADSRFNLAVQSASVDTHHEKRDAHLRGPDFLNARQFPAITFTSTAVEAAEGTMRVSGDLTLHGVTRPIELDLRQVGECDDPKGDHRIGFATQFTIKRSEFGMDKLLTGAGDDVELLVSFEGIRQ